MINRKSLPFVTAIAVIGNLVFTVCTNSGNISGSFESSDVGPTTMAPQKRHIGFIGG